MTAPPTALPDRSLSVSQDEPSPPIFIHNTEVEWRGRIVSCRFAVDGLASPEDQDQFIADCEQALSAVPQPEGREGWVLVPLDRLKLVQLQLESMVCPADETHGVYPDPSEIALIVEAMIEAAPSPAGGE